MRQHRVTLGIVTNTLGKLWMQLRMMERAGQISNLRRQVSYKLFCGDVPIRYDAGRQAVYTADFVYSENGKETVEEWKGFDDPTSKLRRAIFSAMTGIKVKVTGRAKK